MRFSSLTAAVVVGVLATGSAAAAVRSSSDSLTLCVSAAGTVTASSHGACAIGDTVELATAEAARLLGEQLAETRAAFAPRVLDLESEPWSPDRIQDEGGTLQDAILNVVATVAWAKPGVPAHFEWKIDGVVAGRHFEEFPADGRGDTVVRVGGFPCPEGSAFELYVVATDWFGDVTHAPALSGICGPGA